MRKNDWDRIIEGKGFSLEELMHQLTDQLVKIKTYQEQEGTGDPIDVNALFEEAEYRNRYLHEAMESGDAKLRHLAVDAFLIDNKIRNASAKKLKKREELVDESSRTVLSARRVPEVIYARHEKNNLENQATIKNGADSDVPQQRSWPEMMVLNEDVSPETVHEEDSSMPEERSAYTAAETKDSADEEIIDNYEHDPMGNGTENNGAESDDDDDAHHNQPLGTYGLVAILALVIVLIITESVIEEEGGEEELAEAQSTSTEHEQSVERVEAHAALKAAGLPYPELPPILPEVELDMLAQEVLRIHGSHTVGTKLMPLLMLNFLATKGATDIKLVGVNPHDRIIQANYPGRNVPIAIEIESHESSTSFVDLDDDIASIGVVTRPIKDSEIAMLLDRYGGLSSPASEYVIGLDGIGIIVNRSNTVKSLTMQQLAGLFSGGISNWSQVGGRPGPVNIHVREERAGTWDAFKHFVLDRHNQRLAPIYTRYGSDDQLSDSVASDAGGIGFVRFPHVRSTHTIPISDDGSTIPILPTHFRVETEEYALSRRIYMYASARKHEAFIDEFVAFVASPAGQAVVKKLDFIPQTVTKVRPRPLLHATSAYRKLTKGAERLALNFHFQPGHVDLDSKGVHDIPRVANFLAENPAKKGLLLIGFTDSQGKKSRNQQLSVKRAEVVAQRLREYGLTIHSIKGLGESMPIANNEIEFGRNRNRRVEIWVK